MCNNVVVEGFGTSGDSWQLRACLHEVFSKKDNFEVNVLFWFNQETPSTL